MLFTKAVRGMACHLNSKDILGLMKEYDPEYAPEMVHESMFLTLAPETQCYLYFIRYEGFGYTGLYTKTIRFRFTQVGEDFNLSWMGWFA